MLSQLGQMRLESTRFGKSEPACKAYEDKSLSEQLHNAVQRINGEITELDNEIDQISDEQDTSIPADPNVRNFSFALVDGKVYFRERDLLKYGIVYAGSLSIRPRIIQRK